MGPGERRRIEPPAGKVKRLRAVVAIGQCRPRAYDRIRNEGGVNGCLQPQRVFPSQASSRQLIPGSQPGLCDPDRGAGARTSLRWSRREQRYRPDRPVHDVPVDLLRRVCGGFPLARVAQLSSPCAHGGRPSLRGGQSNSTSIAVMRRPIRSTGVRPLIKVRPASPGRVRELLGPMPPDAAPPRLRCRHHRGAPPVPSPGPPGAHLQLAHRSGRPQPLRPRADIAGAVVRA